MPTFEERIAAMKNAQSVGERKKQEEAEKAAAEAATSERETKRGELAGERESVAAELILAEQAADQAKDALVQAEAFAAEQGENLDDAAKAEIDTIKEEAAEAHRTFDEIKARLEKIDVEIQTLDQHEGEGVEETITEKSEADSQPSSEIAEISVEEAERKLEANTRTIADIQKVLQPISRLDGWNERFGREIAVWEGLATIKKAIEGYAPTSTLDKNKMEAAYFNLIGTVSFVAHSGADSGFRDRLASSQRELDFRNLPNAEVIHEAFSKIAEALEAKGMTSLDLTVDRKNLRSMQEKASDLQKEKEKTASEAEELRKKLEPGQEDDLRSNLERLQKENEELARIIPPAEEAEQVAA